MKWIQKLPSTWLLVDSTGRILDEVTRGFDFTYTVTSTGHRYESLEQAQRAAEAKAKL